MKMVSTGQMFLSNYELSRFLKYWVNLYEFFFLGI
jgi:hypothetical protein